MARTKKSIFKKAIMTIGMVVFIVAGYLTVNVTTACKSEAFVCMCSASCILPGSASGALTQIFGQVIAVDLALSVTEIIVAYSGEGAWPLEFQILGILPSILSKIQTVQFNMVAWWDNFWEQNLKPAMQLFTQQLSVAQMEQLTALGQFQDAMNANRLQLEFALQEIQDHRELRPSENVCAIATAASSLGKVTTVSSAYQRAIVQETSNRTLRRVGSGPESRGAAAAVSERMQEYRDRYCDINNNAGHAGCTTSGTFVGQDLDIMGNLFSKDTIPVKANPDLQMIADDMIKNIGEPFVPDNIPAEALGNSVGRDAFFNMQAYVSKRKAIMEALYFPFSRRVEGGAGPDAAAFLNEVRLAANVDPSLLSDNPSYHEIMRVMMSERYRTGQSGLAQVEEPQNNARDLVTQQGFQAMQLRDTLDLLDRYALILAARVGEKVNDAKALDSKGSLKPK